MNTGLVVGKLPSGSCNDLHCPYHGGMKVRGREFTGIVIKTGANKTVTLEFPRLFYLPKYERYEKRRSRVKVHVPGCFEIKVGDKIRVVETRPISKTKNFVIVEVLE